MSVSLVSLVSPMSLRSEPSMEANTRYSTACATPDHESVTGEATLTPFDGERSDGASLGQPARDWVMLNDALPDDTDGHPA